MTRDLLAYGVTTQVLGGGASVIVELAQSPYVVMRYLYSNTTLAVIAGSTSAFPNIPLAYPQGLYVYGPAPLAIAGATVFCVTSLSQGATISQGY